MRSIPSVAVLVGALLAAPAFAQGIPDGDDTAEDTGRGPIGVIESVEEPDAPAADTERAPVSESREEIDAAMPKAHASEDESIYVVQRRAYSKSGKFELTPFFFTSVNNKFVGSLGPAISAAYHVRENFAIELVTSIPYAYYRFYSDLVFEVRALEPPLSPEVVDLKQMTYFGALSLQYSALYGKLDLYDLLVDYDFYVAAGYGLASTVETCAPQDADCGEALDGLGFGQRVPADGADQLKIAGNLGGGMRVFFSDYLGLRVEVRDVVYTDRSTDPDGTTTDIRNNILVLFGLSFLL